MAGSRYCLLPEMCQIRIQFEPFLIIAVIIIGIHIPVQVQALLSIIQPHARPLRPRAFFIDISVQASIYGPPLAERLFRCDAYDGFRSRRIACTGVEDRFYVFDVIGCESVQLTFISHLPTIDIDQRFAAPEDDDFIALHTDIGYTL